LVSPVCSVWTEGVVTAVRPSKATVARVIERDEARCAYCGDEVWGERGWDWSVQHRRPAGIGGDPRPETHAAGNLVLLHGNALTRCHGWAESNREEATALGLLIPKGAKAIPSSFPIRHAVHGWCYLLDDGSWTAEEAAA
jgi:hypothetical protein